MLVLALDTSTAACAVALVELGAPGGTSPAERVRAERSVVDARRHGELLAPLMSEVLDAAGARPAEVGAVVVGIGPGPFTSLRVGMVTGATFAAALGLPAYGVCSLDGIGSATTGAVGVVTDARRREVFWAGYQDGSRVGEPGVGAPAAVAAALAALGARQVIGPGVALYPDAFANLGPASDQAQDRAQVFPAPALLVRGAAAAILRGDRPGPLTPLYLRRPDVAEPHPPKPATATAPVAAVTRGAAGGRQEPPAPAPPAPAPASAGAAES